MSSGIRTAIIAISPTKENTSNILLSVLKTVDPTATEVGKDQGYSSTECKAITA